MQEHVSMAVHKKGGEGAGGGGSRLRKSKEYMGTGGGQEAAGSGRASHQFFRGDRYMTLLVAPAARAALPSGPEPSVRKASLSPKGSSANYESVCTTISEHEWSNFSSRVACMSARERYTVCMLRKFTLDGSKFRHSRFDLTHLCSMLELQCALTWPHWSGFSNKHILHTLPRHHPSLQSPPAITQCTPLPLPLTPAPSALKT
eukprot:1156980-Pelagomonas_calceolata.AAC.4